MDKSLEPMESGDSGFPQTSEIDSRKAKSCKGCLYYSSILRSQGSKARCVGIPRTLSTVSDPNLIGKSEMEASKDGRNLSDFKYFCMGYSVFLESNGEPTEQQTTKAELPFCVGLEILVDRRPVTVEYDSSRTQSNEDGHLAEAKTYRQPESVGSEFFNRFVRNAGVVASGVEKNMQRVGNYVKERLDDIMYPYRRRPK